MNRRRASILIGIMVAFALAIPMSGRADDKNKTVQETIIDFGQPHPQLPAPQSHIIVPNETTIDKNGVVIFRVNGGGHAISVYPVSRDTTARDISEDLCNDSAGSTDVLVRAAVCNAAAGTQNTQHLVTDGDGHLVIDTDTNPPVARGMVGRVYDPNHILLAVPGTPGAGGFLTGSAQPVAGGPITPGNVAGYKFLKTGRYLVICMNRSHSINDWMFGFINVAGDDDR